MNSLSRPVIFLLSTLFMHELSQKCSLYLYWLRACSTISGFFWLIQSSKACFAALLTLLNPRLCTIFSSRMSCISSGSLNCTLVDIFSLLFFGVAFLR